MGGRLERYFIPAIVGFAPLVHLLVTWGPGGTTPLQGIIRATYLPIAAAELFVIIVALRSGLIGALKQWRWQRLPTAALILLVTIAVATTIVAPNPGVARVATAFWLLHLLFGISIAHLTGRIFEGRDMIWALLIGFSTFLCGAMLFAAQVDNPAFDWTHHWPAVSHIRHFGYYIAAMVALAFGLAATTGRPRILAALFALATVSFAFALWTGSRGTIIGLAGGMLAALVLIPQVRRPLAFAGVGLSLIVGAAAAALIPAPADNMGFGRTITSTVASGEVTTGRTQLWQTAFEAILKRPLFGYGEKQMAAVAPFGDITQPHNVVLQVLLAWGAVGLICVLMLAGWYLMRSVPAVRRQGGDLVPPFVAMLALAAFATFDGSLYNPLSVAVFAACAGLVAAGWPARDARQ